nr:MAG TPA: terminase small subunit [Caudoviricetes sp.]
MEDGKTLEEQAAEIISMAEDAGVQENYFFVTTFKRYQVQIGILSQLEESMAKDGMLVSKEYVKGRKNLYSNPAVNAYNRTADSANKTVQTLMKIVKEFGGDRGKDKTKDPLLELINGESEDDDEE